MRTAIAAVAEPPPGERLALALLCDSPDENWRAMDLVAEMLVREISRDFRDRVEPTAISIDLPKLARRSARISTATALNLDRFAGRFIRYPLELLRGPQQADYFHIVDHSYAHLAHVLPANRTGVFCHDLDAFRSLFGRKPERRPLWFRVLQRVVLAGMQRAEIVFYTTATVRDEIERAGLVEAHRLVHAPLGIASEFTPEDITATNVNAIVPTLLGRPYLLHVGSEIARKRLDVVFDTFAQLTARYPQLCLVQNGAAFTPAQREHMRRSGIAHRVLQPYAFRLDRRDLAVLYRQATALLVTSESEGFGIPVIEGLACGAVVFASDIGVFREVAGEAMVPCRVGDPVDWAARIDTYLSRRADVLPRERRIYVASRYTWANHARIIVQSYEALRAKHVV